MEKMVAKFEEKFGSGAEGTLFGEHMTRGPRNSRKGIPRKAFICFALDPRTKFLPTLDAMDKGSVWDAVQADLWAEISRSRTTAGGGTVRSLNDSAPTAQKGNPDTDILHALFAAQQHDSDDDMSEELPANDVANNELNAYRRLRPLLIRDGDGNYSDPLAWWKEHENTLPFFAKLARKTLNVPASSAPSERVFSSAGNYVKKCRARLRSDIVEATVFLHGCWKKMEAYSTCEMLVMKPLKNVLGRNKHGPSYWLIRNNLICCLVVLYG